MGAPRPKNPRDWHWNKRFLMPKSFLYKLHVLQRYTPKQIAEIHLEKLHVSVSERLVVEYLKKYEIYKTAPPVEVRLIDGDLWKLAPKHNLANKWGRVMLKVLVAEKKYRLTYRSKKHRIDFIDGDHLNCHPSNVRLVWKKRKLDMSYGTYTKDATYVKRLMIEDRRFDAFLDSLPPYYRLPVLRNFFRRAAAHKRKNGFKEHEKNFIRAVIERYGYRPIVTIRWVKIERLRKDTGLSVAGLCRKAGFDKMKYHRIKYIGTNRWGYWKTVLKISGALNVSPSEISEGITE